MQLDPAVAIDAAGEFVIAWTGGKQDGFEPALPRSSPNVSRPPAPSTSTVTAPPSRLTDGLLILRRLFDFTGATLIAGAVDLVDCTRCTAPAIEQYIAHLGLQLDIDGDGELEPLTDGLLIARWLFGFRGATLTNNAVDLSDCTRCTARRSAPISSRSVLDGRVRPPARQHTNASPPTATVSSESELSTGRPRNAHTIIHAETARNRSGVNG